MPMYNLMECSSNYSEIARSLLFYSESEATNSNTDITTNNNFHSFKYKKQLFISNNTVILRKLLGNTEVGGVNGILKKCNNWGH